MSKAVITFGRMNPPTVGHQKVVDKVKAEAKKQGAMPHVYLSHSQDKKKNPLDYNTKLNTARKAFGSSVTRSDARTIIEVMVELQKMQHKEVTVIAGSDRVREFRTLLNKYNGKDFKFDKIAVKSAGARDPDAEGAAGMSATKMRTAAQTGDYDSFKKGVPPALSDRDTKAMYNKIRSEMGVMKEEIEWTEEDFEFTDAELDAAVAMINFDALDEDTEIDEEFADYLEEERKPLTISQRMAIGRRMKRLAPRMARMRKIRAKRMADPKRIEGRARKAAIKILRKRFAGKQGQNYAKLSPGSKMSVDRIIAKKASVIPKLAKRLLPKLRKAEMERLKKVRGGAAPETTKAAKTLKQGDHVEPHVPILYEEEVDTKLMALLRVTFPDSSERNLVVRALRGGSKSLQNPSLRPYLMNVLLRLLDGVQDDPSIYNKVKEKMRRLSLDEKQDPDIKDRKGSQPASYHSGLKKSTKVARDRHFKKYAEKPGQDKKDSDANYKPAPGDAKGKTKLSKHTKKYRAMFGEDINTAFEELFFKEEVLTEKQIAGLVKKAEKSGIPYGILKQVYNRGMAAWKSGHRPGATPQQWAFARVNSFITKGKGTWGKADKDLAAKVRGSKTKLGEAKMSPSERDRLDDLLMAYRWGNSSFGFDDDAPNPDKVLKLIKKEFGDKIANQLIKSQDKIKVGRFGVGDRKTPTRITKTGKANKSDLNALKNRLKNKRDWDKIKPKGKLPEEKELEKAVQEDAIKSAKDKISREKEADKRKHDAMLDRARLQKAQNKNRATEENEHEIEVDGYQTKNFHMCGSAQKVMKKLASKEGAKELTQMQDKFYGLEKQIVQDGAASKEQKAAARMMHDKIMARAKQVGLDDEIGEYMKMHIDSIEKGKPKLGFGRTDINEVLGKDATVGDYVKDFQKSDAPQFKGKSKEKRQKMAVAAYLDKKDKMNESLDEKFESLFLEEPRVPRKPGQPAGSDKHSDLYTDENPKDTIHGLKFATVKDAEASVKKIESSGRKHAHKVQAAVAMEQRARVAGKKGAAAVYRKYINKMKDKTKDKQDESLWANIHKKRQRIKRGSGERMRKPGEKGAPTADALRKAKSEEYIADEECTCFDHIISEAEYKGRKVKLNDPMRSNDGKKKFYVYVKNEKGNVVKVGFGDPNMEIKRDDPGRRKNFRARHNCDNPGPKWKARYWSCFQWRAGAKVDN